VEAPALFDRLLDDAGLFPPAALPMKEAVAAHLSHLSAWYAAFVGPFVCPETRLGSLSEELVASGTSSPVEVSVIVTGVERLAPAASAVAALPPVELSSLEVPLGTAEAALTATEALEGVVGALPPGVDVYAEVPWSGQREEIRLVAEALGRAGVRAKIRTGGLEAALFPDETHLGVLLLALARERVAFKCTAGLHEAVRRRGRTGRTGFEQMGFANILLATAAASGGSSIGDVAALLAEDDEAEVARQVAALDPSVRESFRSFGTCSVLEPVEDLVRLGLVSAPVSSRQAPAPQASAPQAPAPQAPAPQASAPQAPAPQAPAPQAS
jgi:hypothetical protein